MALLKNIETHVRVMAERETLQLTDKGVNFVTGAQHTTLPYGGQFSGFSHVHRERDTNRDFFESSLRKIVSSASAGQHHTVLICGPPQSGRSQTMYDVQGPGVVHLTAEALLQLPGTTVHYTAFNVRGSHLYDSFTGESISTTDMPAPVGLLPLSGIRLLENPSDAVVVAKDKRADTSSFIAFHIYRPVSAGGGQGGGRKEAFGSITFVDLCSFGDPLPADLSRLSTAVDKVLAGSDPQFAVSLLTQLLESSLKGGRTMTVVCTITGHKSHSPAACEALDFTLRLSRIGQVAPLCLLIPPRWFDELPRSVELMEISTHQRLKQHYEQGVFTVYELFKDALSEARQGLQGLFHSDCAFEEARRQLAENLQSRLDEIQGDAQSYFSSIDSMQNQAQGLRSTAEELERRHASALRQLAAVEKELRDDRAVREQVKASTSLQISRLEATRLDSERRVAHVSSSVRTLQAGLREAEDLLESVYDRARKSIFALNRDSALQKLDAKRRRIEKQLEETSDRAAELCRAMDDDAERKSVVRTTYPAPSGINEAPFRKGKKSQSRPQSSIASGLL